MESAKLVSKKMCPGCNNLRSAPLPLRYDCILGAQRDFRGDPFICRKAVHKLTLDHECVNKFLFEDSCEICRYLSGPVSNVEWIHVPKCKCCKVCKDMKVGLLGKLSNRSLGIQDKDAKADKCVFCCRELRFYYNAGGGVALHETSSTRLHDLVDIHILEDLEKLFVIPEPRPPRSKKHPTGRHIQK